MFWYGESVFSGVSHSISSCIETGSGYRYCLHYRETQSGKSRLIVEFELYGELLTFLQCWPKFNKLFVQNTIFGAFLMASHIFFLVFQ